LNQLYKFTSLQSTFGVQMLALVGGEPRLLSLKRALQLFLEHRRVVITRRSQFELEKARARAHILEGLLIALANLDEVIKIIRESRDADLAKEKLMTRFKLSELQAVAILDMQLRRLAALERQKIEDEQRDVIARISYLEDLLANPNKILDVIKSDLTELVEKYGDQRRTHIAQDASEEFHEEDLVPDEAILISITQRGYIKRVLAKSFRPQARGSRGVAGHTTKEEDEILVLIPARTLDTLLFFSDKGKVYSEKAYQIPDADRAGKGIPVVNVLALDAGETITAIVPVPDFQAAQYCVMATRKGRIKRMVLSELASVRPSGLVAISLDEGDELGWVRLTQGDDDIILVTEKGWALRYSEKALRPMGRMAGGVTGIRLKKGDFVTSLEVIEPDGELLVVTTLGFGKRTSLDEYPVKGRATGGVQTIKQSALAKIGHITAARVVQAGDDLSLISTNGVLLRTRVNDIPLLGRTAKGVSIMGLSQGDQVASVARIGNAELRQIGVSEAE